MLALTFDDGPGQYTERLLNCLEENGAHATFFMLGELIPSYPEEVQHMLRIGCELGNHSYDHSQLTNLSLDDVAGQSLVKTDVTVTPEDRIVTLSTCTGNSATRFIVQGVLEQMYIAK